MQKALSLYIDSQLFEKNRLARLYNQETYQKQLEKSLTKTPCSLPHFPLHDGLLLDLRQYPKIASIKHSQLGLDFFEEAYLGTCPYQFAKVSLDNMEKVLNYLKSRIGMTSNSAFFLYSSKIKFKPRQRRLTVLKYSLRLAS